MFSFFTRSTDHNQVNQVSGLSEYRTLKLDFFFFENTYFIPHCSKLISFLKRTITEIVHERSYENAYTVMADK